MFYALFKKSIKDTISVCACFLRRSLSHPVRSCLTWQAGQTASNLIKDHPFLYIQGFRGKTPDASAKIIVPGFCTSPPLKKI